MSAKAAKTAKTKPQAEETKPQAEETKIQAEETKIQKALNLIEAKPGILTDELSKALDVPQKSIAPLLYQATQSHFVVTCAVSRPGLPPMTAYRITQAAVAADWNTWKATHRTEGNVKPLANKATVRRAGSEPKGTSKIGGTSAALQPLADKTGCSLIEVAMGGPLNIGLALGVCPQPGETDIELAHWLNLAHDCHCETPDQLRAWLKDLRRPIKDTDTQLIAEANARQAALVEKTKAYEIRIAELQAELNRRIDGVLVTSDRPLRPPEGYMIGNSLQAVGIVETEGDAIEMAMEEAIATGTVKVYALTPIGIAKRYAAWEAIKPEA